MEKKKEIGNGSEIDKIKKTIIDFTAQIKEQKQDKSKQYKTKRKRNTRTN